MRQIEYCLSIGIYIPGKIAAAVICQHDWATKTRVMAFHRLKHTGEVKNFFLPI